MTPIRIGNASGFYGDRFTAWREMLDGGELDVLTGDYLAELTMLILGRDRQRDPALGYAKTFLRQMTDTLGSRARPRREDRDQRRRAQPGRAGPASALARAGRQPARIGYVEGDALRRPGALTANAYLGAFGIAACLDAGADIVVTGRVTDASLVVGPAVAHFGWGRDDLDALAGATVAGHVIECGAQATGGNFSFFTELPDGGRRPGLPDRRGARRRLRGHHQASGHRRRGHRRDRHRPAAVRDRRTRLPRPGRGDPPRHGHAGRRRAGPGPSRPASGARPHRPRSRSASTTSAASATR